jgi:tetratricopeptide (TPR) repeat protein
VKRLHEDYARRRLRRIFLLLALAIVLSACSSKTSFVRFEPPPPLLHQGTPVEIMDIDVLEMTPEMDAFLEKYILPYNNSQTRLHLLSTAISNSGVLGFEYDPMHTYTAAEAFKYRSGNCIAFANMMVALARRAGLKASYQEIIRNPTWTSVDDTVLLIKHVNVVIESNKYTYVMDASDLEISQRAQRRIVNDSYAKALYLNNLGAEALFNNDLPLAYAYQSRAIQTNPEVTDSWVNMSVVLGRNDQMDDAVTVLRKALSIDSDEYSAMNNLYEIYMEQGNLLAAGELKAKVDRYRRNNPYFLLQLSKEAVELNQFEQAIELLERAIRKKDNDHLLHYALAKTLYLSGQEAAARDSMDRARELAPLDKLVYYQRPLNELIAEERFRAEQEEQLKQERNPIPPSR